MTSETGNNTAYLICFAVISIAVTGYFIGLQSPMNPVLTTPTEDATFPLDEGLPHHFGDTTMDNSVDGDAGVVPATNYSDMKNVTFQRAKTWQTSLAGLKSDADPMAIFEITSAQKSFALAYRDQNRAFNGAPPTVPHPVDQMSSLACAACHSDGMHTETFRIPKMSHQFLENCTQCHVESNPKHMQASLFRENTFVGLPAPEGGPRAFEGAPPQIPHSTWMRSNCMSCHGFAGVQGIRTTHPWRKNCQQCHAPSSVLDQVQLDSEPQFLPPPEIEK